MKRNKGLARAGKLGEKRENTHGAFLNRRPQVRSLSGSLRKPAGRQEKFSRQASGERATGLPVEPTLSAGATPLPERMVLRVHCRGGRYVVAARCSGPSVEATASAETLSVALEQVQAAIRAAVGGGR